MLEVRVIGTFDIQCDGKPVTLSSRAAQSLLAYLILTAGKTHRREQLAGMFWPDVAEEKARASLRHELWLIRKALSSSKLDYLIADDIHIAFNVAANYWLDAASLDDESRFGSIDELMTALSLYQGELLPGFYDDWITHEREHLQVVYEQKMARLLELLEGEKRWQEILEWAERWISFVQGSEAAYRYLMIAYDASGDRAKVASTYQRCVQALHELDLEPSEQTRALAFKRTSRLNIPIPLTSFIGREKELKEVAELLSKSRLVTLTGSGGVGKTRLAIQVVADVLELFPDCVWFLDLAPLSDAARLPDALAEALDLHLMGGSDLSITDLIIGYLRSRRALIIFDNCEHLIDDCARLVDLLLTSCEHLSILATSREVLRISGEIPYRVPSLELPRWDVEPVMDALANIESVRLFVQRAMVISPRLDIGPHNGFIVAQICKRLDGIPLAIELAAARVNMLTVEQILKRLDDRFNLLTGGFRNVVPRHQTLRATIEWSYDLLSNEERTLLQRLSVFVGGWSLEGAGAVCGYGDVLDLIAHLVDKSLVAVDSDPPNEIRYYLLETIRQYASEKLHVSNDEAQIRALHLEYFVKFTDNAGSKLRGLEQREYLNRLEKEYDNVRAALEYSRISGRVAAGIQIAWSLILFWSGRGYWSEVKVLLADLLAQPGAWEKTPLRVKGLIVAGLVATLLNDIAMAQLWLDESIEIARELDPNNRYLLAVSLGLKGYSIMGSDLDLARSLCEKALAIGREIDDKYVIANVLDYLGNIFVAQGDYQAARAASDESLAVFLLTDNRWMSSRPLGNLGLICYKQGDYESARSHLEAGLEIYREIGDKANIAFTLAMLADIDRIGCDYIHSASRYEESLGIRRAMGDELSIPPLLVNLGQIRIKQGNISQAMELFREGLALSRRIDDNLQISICLTGFASLAAAKQQPELAVRLLGIAASTMPVLQKTQPPLFLAEKQKLDEMLRNALGNEVYAAIWEAGKQMGLEEAVAHALKELQ